MDKKLDCFIKDMSQRGVTTYLVTPWQYLLLRRFGFKMRPPMFQSFLLNVICYGFSFATVVGLLVWFIQHIVLGLIFHWPYLIQRMGVFLTTDVFLGIAMGCYFAAMCAREAKRLALPKWEDYAPHENES